MFERLTGIGSVASSFLAALCCVGLPFFAALGLSSMGLSLVGTLAPYRRLFMSLAIVLLGIAHYLARRKSRKGQRASNHTMVWVTTIISLVILAVTIRREGL